MINQKIEQAKEYKRKVAGGFIAISGDDLESKLSGSSIYVSKKIDGEFNLLWFDGKQSVLINGNGKVKDSIPLLKQASEAFSANGVKSLTAAVELHLDESDGRSRVAGVMSAIANNSTALTLSLFDLLEVDGEDVKEADYKTLLEKADNLLRSSGMGTVSLNHATNPKEVMEIYQQTVIERGAEGLVIRSSEFPIIYKAKPVYTIDAAIIGFTEGEESDKVREILLGLMHEDGTYSQVGRTGNGFSEEQKAQLFETLSANKTESSYIEADKRKVAFHMVKPAVVVEIACNELTTENSKGTIKNPLLVYDDVKGWSFISSLSGISMQHPVFKSIREDKSINSHDIRFAQVTDIAYLESESTGTASSLPESEVIFREVYTKAAKGSTNVQKFLVWKTNKAEMDNRWPVYVLHYTNFSPTRGEPLKRDVRVSSSEEQIMALKDNFIEKNIKKGWEKV